LAPIFVAILCAITGVLILCAKPNFQQTASQICVSSFNIAFHSRYAGWFIPIVIYFFSMTTLLAWAWFGEHVFFFIQKPRWRIYYQSLFIAFIPIGACMRTTLPWTIADICIDGLLLINLISIFCLRKDLNAIMKTNNQHI
jgi:AGCS family alanine or glycine:cation symporter